MKIRSGQLLIIAMLSAGVAAALFSWTFRLLATGESVQFWGPEMAHWIRDATQVEGWVLQPAEALHGDEDPQVLTIATATYRIVAQHDLSTAPGLTHLRYALLEDRSFRWNDPPGTDSTPWKFVLLLRDDDSAAPRRIVLSEDCCQIAAVETSGRLAGRASCEPIAAGLAAVFQEWLSDRPDP